MEYDDEEELTRHVWDHYSRLMTDFEKKLSWANLAQLKVAAGRPELADWILRRHGIAGDAESEAAMADGVEAFRRRVCRRLLAEHAGGVVVNCSGLWPEGSHPASKDWRRDRRDGRTLLPGGWAGSPDHRRFGGSRRPRMQVVLADPVKELVTTDAHMLGGPGAIAAAGDQGEVDRPALDLGQQGFGDGSTAHPSRVDQVRLRLIERREDVLLHTEDAVYTAPDLGQATA